MLKQNVSYDINQNRIIEKIKKYKVISFDIFDTVIKRDCCDGKQLFDMMQKNLTVVNSNFKNFATNRVEAERKAREKSRREEITFEEIYEEFQSLYSASEIMLLQENEIKYEKALCKLNKHLSEVYKYCIKNNKRVIFISDMYLPLSVIKELLDMAGIKVYEKIYLSSEIFKTKRTGTLYDHVIKDLKISPKDIVHIGDDLKRDVLMSRRSGIASIKIRHSAYFNMMYNPNKIIGKKYVGDYCALSSFIDNHFERGLMSDDHYFYRAGYEMEGPLLVGFSKWLNNELNIRGIEKVFFLSRDGQIMQKAYTFLYGNNIVSKYMYASRRSLIVPTLWMCNTFEEVVNSMFFPRIGTISAFLKKLGLNEEIYSETIQKYGFDISKYYIYSELFNSKTFRSFYDEIKREIYDNSKSEYDILVDYLKKIEFSGKIAIVDIGWHGNMQKALVKICNQNNIPVEIYGFYLGLNPNVCDLVDGQINASGFLFQKGNNENYFELQRNFSSIMEMMFTANHGSVRKFTEDENNIVPMLEPFEYSDSLSDLKDIQEIQRGALKFIQDVLTEPEFYIEWEPATVFQNMILLGNAPDYKAACKFGDIRMLGDKVIFLAKPQKITSYILKPQNLKIDLRNNSWKMGFFKRLCKINLPYFEGYFILRKIYLKSKRMG